MQCINDECNSLTTRVYETRATLAAVYRRRKCLACGAAYVSVEVVSPAQTIPESMRKTKRQEKIT